MSPGEKCCYPSWICPLSTSDPERGGPGRTPIGAADPADVEQLRVAVQPPQTAVHRVQPLLVGQLAGDGPQLLKRARFRFPGDTRSWVDVVNGALHLLIATQPGQI